MDGTDSPEGGKQKEATPERQTRRETIYVPAMRIGLFKKVGDSYTGRFGCSEKFVSQFVQFGLELEHGTGTAPGILHISMVIR